MRDKPNVESVSQLGRKPLQQRGMAFWGVRIKPYQSCTLHSKRPPRTLRMTRATLDDNPEAYGKRSSVWCIVGDKPAVILCALTDKHSVSLDLEFELTENVIFDVRGKRGVSLSGYYLKSCDGNKALAVNVHGEEDIENTDIEYSSDNDSEENAYDLSDSFIDDSPLCNHLNFPKIEDLLDSKNRNATSSGHAQKNVDIGVESSRSGKQEIFLKEEESTEKIERRGLACNKSVALIGELDPEGQATDSSVAIAGTRIEKKRKIEKIADMAQTKYFDVFWSSSVGTKGSEKELAKKKGEGVPMETEITLNNSRAIKNHLDGGTACGTYCKEEYIRQNLESAVLRGKAKRTFQVCLFGGSTDSGQSSKKILESVFVPQDEKIDCTATSEAAMVKKTNFGDDNPKDDE